MFVYITTWPSLPTILDSNAKTHSPDTPDAFASSREYGVLASAAPSKVDHFLPVANVDIKGTNTSVLGGARPTDFLIWYNMRFYDPKGCASLCMQTHGCIAFNVCT